jgi:hypothetical protein
LTTIDKKSLKIENMNKVESSSIWWF